MNGFAGRPGEWQSLRRRDALKQLYEHPHYLTMQEFKTSQKFIAVGKGIFDGTLQAILAYASLPSVDGEDMDLLFPPTPVGYKMTYKSKGRQDSTVTTTVIQASDAVERGQAMYMQAFPSLMPTTLRKQLCTKTSNQEISDDFKLLAALDTHSVRTAMRHYDLSKYRPRDLAERGCRIFQKYIGNPVPYPSAEEVKQSRRVVEVILAKNYKCSPEAAVDVSAQGPSPQRFRRIVKTADGSFKMEGEVPVSLRHGYRQIFRSSVLLHIYIYIYIYIYMYIYVYLLNLL